MPQLIPHLLLRSDAASSEVAIALRDAGYHVTKVRDDDTAVRTLALLPVEAVIVELPVVACVGFVRRLRTTITSAPLLALTVAPEALRRAAEPIDVYDVRDGLSHLITAADLLIARHEMRTAS